MKKVIDFIIEIGWDLLPIEEVISKLKAKFNIVNRQGEPATEEFIETVVFWEKHTEIYESLEKMLNDRFKLI